MRVIQKLIRNGNSTQFTIPRPVLIHLGWIPGEMMMLEVLEEGELCVRRPRESDFRNVSVKRSVVQNVEASK